MTAADVWQFSVVSQTWSLVSPHDAPHTPSNLTGSAAWVYRGYMMVWAGYVRQAVNKAPIIHRLHHHPSLSPAIERLRALLCHLCICCNLFGLVSTPRRVACSSLAASSTAPACVPLAGKGGHHHHHQRLRATSGDVCTGAWLSW